MIIKKKIIICLVLLGLTGCSSFPCSTGCVSEHTSTFDGAKELSLSPSYIYRNNKGISGSDMRIGLYWSSSLPENNIVLILLPHKDKPVAAGTKINFNINGAITELSSVTKDKIKNLNPSTDSSTYFNPNVIEQMNVLYYVVQTDFVNKIISADDVRVRLDLENTYLEGYFSHDSAAAAKSDFNKFMAKLNEELKTS